VVKSSARFSQTVIGLGNEFLSDDGVGIRVLRELKERFFRRDIAFEELSVGGLGLLDYFTGSDKCIIIDAVITGNHPPGTILRCVVSGDRPPPRIHSSHQLDLGEVLALGQMLGADLPGSVTVYGIEADDVTTFCERCTANVFSAIPLVVEAVYNDLESSTPGRRIPTDGWEIIQEHLLV
jgi:hydrogenase maturation protease